MFFQHTFVWSLMWINFFVESVIDGQNAYLQPELQLPRQRCTLEFSSDSNILSFTIHRVADDSVLINLIGVVKKPSVVLSFLPRSNHIYMNQWFPLCIKTKKIQQLWWAYDCWSKCVLETCSSTISSGIFFESHPLHLIHEICCFFRIHFQNKQWFQYVRHVLHLL